MAALPHFSFQDSSQDIILWNHLLRQSHDVATTLSTHTWLYLCQHKSLFWRCFTSTLDIFPADSSATKLARHMKPCRHSLTWNLLKRKGKKKKKFFFYNCGGTSSLSPPPLVNVSQYFKRTPQFCVLQRWIELVFSCELWHLVVTSLLPEHMNQLVQTNCFVKEKKKKIQSDCIRKRKCRLQRWFVQSLWGTFRAMCGLESLRFLCLLIFCCTWV